MAAFYAELFLGDASRLVLSNFKKKINHLFPDCPKDDEVCQGAGNGIIISHLLKICFNNHYTNKDMFLLKRQKGTLPDGIPDGKANKGAEIDIVEERIILMRN